MVGHGRAQYYIDPKSLPLRSCRLRPLFFMFIYHSLSRNRVLDMLLPKNYHFKVKLPKVSLKQSKISIFFSFFSKIIEIIDYKKRTEVSNHFGYFLGDFVPKLTKLLKLWTSFWHFFFLHIFQSWTLSTTYLKNQLGNRALRIFF